MKTREQIIADIQAWVDSLPEEKRNQVTFSDGEHDMSPQSTLDEIKNDTELGKHLVKIYQEFDSSLEE